MILMKRKQEKAVATQPVCVCVCVLYDGNREKPIDEIQSS